MALWLGFSDLLPYALIASICRRRTDPWPSCCCAIPLPALLARQGWILRLHDARSGIPYGVALATGAFFLLPSTEIFRLAAAA